LPNLQDSQPKVKTEDSIGTQIATFVQKDDADVSARIEQHQTYK